MPPERHSSPPPRPARDRHTGPGFGGPRRSFGGGFGGGPPREGGGPRPPFPPRPAAPAEPAQSVRLREGDREVEVHGNAAFIRQTLEDLPGLFARLRGEAAAPSRPASISMPRPPRAAEEEPVDEFDEDLDEEDEEEPEPPARAATGGGRRERHPAKGSPADGAARRDRHPASGAGAEKGRRAANGRLSLEDRIFSALEHADHPLSVAAIRKQIGGDTTGQQVRRILERASDRVVATSERPAAYALR